MYFAVLYANGHILKINVDSDEFRNYNKLNDQIDATNESESFGSEVENKISITNLDKRNRKGDKVTHNINGLDEKSILALLRNAEINGKSNAVVTVHNINTQDENRDEKEDDKNEGSNMRRDKIAEIGELIKRILINATNENNIVYARNGADESYLDKVLGKHGKPNKKIKEGDLDENKDGKKFSQQR